MAMATQQQQQQQQQQRGEYVIVGVDPLLSTVISTPSMPYTALDELSLAIVEYRPSNNNNNINSTITDITYKKTIYVQRQQKTFSKDQPAQLMESVEQAQVRLSAKSLQCLKDHLQQASNALTRAIEDAMKSLKISKQTYATSSKANHVAKAIEGYLGKMYGFIIMQFFPLCEKDIAEQKQKYTQIMHNPNMLCESTMSFTELVSFVHPLNATKQKDEFLIILSPGQYYKDPAYPPTEWYKLALIIQRINQDTKEPVTKKNLIIMSTLETEALMNVFKNHESNLAKFFPVTLGFICTNNQQSLATNKTWQSLSANWTNNSYLTAFHLQEMQSRGASDQLTTPPNNKKLVRQIMHQAAAGPPRKKRAITKRRPLRIVDDGDDGDDDDDDTDANANNDNEITEVIVEDRPDGNDDVFIDEEDDSEMLMIDEINE